MKKTSGKIAIRIMALLMTVMLLVGYLPASAEESSEPSQQAAETAEQQAETEAEAQAPEEYAEPEENPGPAQTGELADLAETGADPYTYTCENRISGTQYFKGLSQIEFTLADVEPESYVNVLVTEAGTTFDSLEDSVKWRFRSLTNSVSPEDVASNWSSQGYSTLSSAGENSLKVTIDVAKAAKEILTDNGKALDGSTGLTIFYTTGKNYGSLYVNHEELTVYLDNEGPSILASDISNVWYTGEVTVRFSVADESGVASVIDNGYGIRKNNDLYEIALNSTVGADSITVTATDGLGNTTDYTVADRINIDTHKPEITEITAPSGWTDTAVKVNVKAADTESGIDPAKFYVDTDSAPESDVTYNSEGGYYEILVRNTDSNDHTIWVYDAAGNKSDVKEFKTTYDKTAPAADDIEVDFSRGTALGGILNILTFGLYRNDDIKMTVKVSRGGGSDIVDIAAKDDNYGDIGEVSGSDITYDSQAQLFAAEFTLIKGDKAYKNISVKASDEAGFDSGHIAIKNVKAITADDGETVKSVKDLFGADGEVVATAIAPSVELASSGFKSMAVGSNTLYTGEGKFSVAAGDNMSGLKSIKLYFDKADKFSSDTNAPLSGTDPVAELSDISKDSKVTSKTLDYTVEAGLSGTYILYAVAENNSGTPNTAAAVFYFDSASPVISEPVYDAAWTNQSIPASFTVSDLSDAVNAGVKEVKVNGTVIEPADDGSYSFDMTERKDYEIIAVDNFGNTSPSFTIKAEDVPFDNTKPEAASVVLSNDNIANDKITITVTPTDDLSLVKRVYAYEVVDGAETDEPIVFDGDYKAVITANGKHEYNIYVEDNAGNISLPIKKATCIDNSDIVIEKLEFSDYTTLDKFGVYANKELTMTFTAQNAGLAVLQSAKYTVGESVITATISDDGSKASFKIAVSDNGKAIEKLFSTVFTFTNTAGTSISEKLSDIMTDSTIYVGVDETITAKPALFEVIATNSNAEITVEAPTFSKSSGDVHSGVNGSVTSVIVDSLSGIDYNTVEAYFGLASEFDGNHKPKDAEAMRFTDFTLTDASHNAPKSGKKNTFIRVNAVLSRDEALESGKYVFSVAVKNLSGNDSYNFTEFYVDNTAPEVTVTGYTVNGEAYDESKWYNTPITVNYTVNDKPDNNNSGIDSVAVKGKINNADYSPASVSDDGNYSFEADYNQVYVISAADSFGRPAADAETKKLRYDADAPVIGEFTYGEGVDASTSVNDVDWASAENGMTVSFGVHDITNGASGKQGFVLSDIKSVYVIEGDAEDMTEEQIKAVNETTPGVIVPELVHSSSESYTYSFNAVKYSKYTVIAFDNAGNYSKKTTSTVKIDSEAPEITGVKFEKNETGMEKVLRFLTFGLYSNDNIKMTVSVKDGAPSSGIKEITAEYNGEALEADKAAFAQGVTDPDKAQSDVEETVSFKIPLKKSVSSLPEIMKAGELVIYVEDNAGHNNGGQTLSRLSEQVRENHENASTSDEFEIVNTEDTATFDEAATPDETEPMVIDDISIAFTNPAGYVISPADRDTPVYSGAIGGDNDAVISLIANDDLSGLYDGGVTVSLIAPTSGEAEDITDKCSITYTESKNGKKTAAEIVYNTGVLESGLYTFIAVIENNSGNPITKQANFYVDNSEPTIDDVAFTVNGEAYDETKWYNTPITVSYKVSEHPDIYGGVDSVSVEGRAGVEEHKDYSPETVKDDSAKYSFEAKFNQKYQIKATDVFGRESAVYETNTLNYDADKPNIGDFAYGDSHKSDISEVAWAKNIDGILITFDADDITDGASGLKDSNLSGIKSVYVVESADAEGLTDEELMAIDANAGTISDLTFTEHDDYSISYSFKAKKFTKYTVIVTDNAGNVSTKTTQTVKVDKSNPTVESVVFENYEDALDAVLRYLTFGLYSNSKIRMTVTVRDAEPSSGFKTVEAYDNTSGKYFSSSIKGGSFKTAPADPEAAAGYTETVYFILPDKILDENISIYVEDMVGYAERELTAAEWRKSGSVYYDGGHEEPDPVLSQENEFEIISKSTEDEASISSTISIDFTNPAGEVVSPAGEKKVYSGKVRGTNDAVITLNAADEEVGLLLRNGIKLSLTDLTDGTRVPKDITDKCTIKYSPDSGKRTSATVIYNTGVLKSGHYEFTAVIENNAGVKTTDSVDFYVDNSEPTISEPSYSVNGKAYEDGKWYNTPITVTYKVSEHPEVYGGVDSISVMGENWTNYSPKTVKKTTDEEYSFDADYNQTYTINAVDVFGRQSADKVTEEIRYDSEAPNISDFSYGDGKADINDVPWANAEDGILVTFTVDDKSKGVVSEEGKILSGVKEVYVVEGDADSDSAERVSLTLVAASDGVTTYSFVADKYSKYTAVAYDNAGNKNNKTTRTIKIDKDKPYVTDITFTDNASGFEKVLSFLTFGLYHNADIRMTVTVSDDAPSSGIASISVNYGDKSFTENIVGDAYAAEADPDKATGYTEKAYFIIPANVVNKNDIMTAGSMFITVTDNVGYDNGTQSVSSLYEKMTNHSKANGSAGFEVVASEKAPVITEISLDQDGKSPVYTDDAGNNWYNGGNVKAGFGVSDVISKLHSVNVTLNGQNITQYLHSADYNANGSVVYTDGKNGEDLVSEDKYIDSDSFTLNSDEYAAVTSRTGSGAAPVNKIEVTAAANNGNISTNDVTYYIDDVEPIIQSILFTGDSVIAYDAETNLPVKDDEFDRNKDYVYYFKYQTKVTVTATDLTSPDGRAVVGSGIRDIYFLTVDFDTDEVKTQMAVNSAANSADYTADFYVEADFRGMIYAYAIDKVENEGAKYTPYNTIVESLEEHNAGSSTEISIADTNFTNRQDNNQHNLYSGDAYVTFTVKDRYSGLGEINYSISNDNGIIEEVSAVIGNDGSITDYDPRLGDNTAWNVDSKNHNIITSATKTVRLIGADMHNFNNLVIKVWGRDRAGFDIAESEEIISIDTTKPTIELSFDNDDGATYRTEEKRYFKEHRVATITVTERNFDPADFAPIEEMIINYEGSDPAVVGQTAWSTVYDDYTDESKHVATITFAEDGDYKLKLNYTDEAGNKADEVESEEFVIDNIDPVIDITFEDSGAQNNNYYKDPRIAHVTVTEHNFAQGEGYIEYLLTATEGDNTTPRSTPAMALDGWTDDGSDKHSTTILFNEDGRYEFTVKYTDKAKRTAEDKKAETFYIDLNKGTIEFSGVADKCAYGGQDEVIAPIITYTDNNIDNSRSTYTVHRISYEKDRDKDKTDVDDLVTERFPVSTNDGVTTKVVSFDNFEALEENDGVYRLDAAVYDMAGNYLEASITFSVNRFGATFVSFDEPTKALLASGYTNSEQDIKISEINVTDPKSSVVTLTFGTSTKELSERTDYTCVRDSSVGSWHKYDYVIKKENFSEEGDYALTITSDIVYTNDALNRKISNRTALTKDRNCDVNFVVDKTDPDITITGIESNTPYREAEKSVKVICLDSNIDISTLSVKLNGEELDPADYTVTELIGEIDIDLKIEAGLDKRDFNLDVAVKDLASNEGLGNVENVELSASLLTMFFHNTAAVIITSAGLLLIAGLAVFLVMRKRKNAAAAAK